MSRHAWWAALLGGRSAGGGEQQIGEGHDQLVDDSFTSTDGRLLLVSRPRVAGDDEIDVVKCASQRRVAQIRVGDHPQRTRMGRVLTSILGPAGRVALPVRLRSHRVHGHAHRVRLRSTVAVTSLRARLRRGGRTYATGRRPYVAGRGSMRLRPRRHQHLRPGRYKLVLRGTLADGVKGVRAFRVRVR